MIKPAPLEKDHTFLNQTISSLTDQIDLFETFQDLSLKIISQFDLKNILTTSSEIIKEVIHYDSVAIYLFENNHQAFKPIYSSKNKAAQNNDCINDERLIKWVMNQGRWTVLTDFEDASKKEIVSVLPLKSPNQALGFMVITTGVTPDLYNQKISSIINFLASQTAIAIENQMLYARINNANAYLTNMLESINNGIMVVDLKKQLTLINRNTTAILGIKEKNLTGQTYDRFLKGELKQELDRLFLKVSNNKFAPESMVMHSPYKEVTIMVGITPSLLTDKNKTVIGIIFIFRDMSASKEIERLTLLDQMKSEFVSNVSHELRTPLSVIKSYTEALLTQVAPEDKETRDHFLSVIDSETDRLTSIVGNLLDLSRIEAGKFTLDLSFFSLKALIESILLVYQTKLENISILTEFEDDLPKIQADKEKIREVLVNLIANSIKFSPTGGIISIVVEKQKESFVCSVSDTGIGIPKDKLKKIFAKFYRVDSSDTYEIEGTGLGLSIVKHIVDSHQGTITVDSELGKGSVFTFYLPEKQDAQGVDL